MHKVCTLGRLATSLILYICACPACIDLLSFEESNVEEGGVEVDKLEQVHLADEAVIIFGLGAVEL